MRLIEYLNEATLTESSFDKLLPDYSEIVKIYKKSKGHFLFRSSDRKFMFASKKPRKLRKPRTISIQTHNLLDELFYDKFGWKARSEGLFTSTNMNTDYYGINLYIIFPMNGFKYIYANGIYDIYNHIAGEDEERIKETVKKYTDKGLQKLITAGTGIEVTIKCDKYYSLLYTDNNLMLLDQWLKDTKI